METLSSESKVLYDLFRADITTNVDSLIYASQDCVLKCVQKMLDNTHQGVNLSSSLLNVVRIDGSLTSKIDAVREDLGVDIAQLRLAEDKGARTEPQRSPSTFSSHADDASSGTNDQLQTNGRGDKDQHPRPSNLYVPPHVPGVHNRLSLPITLVLHPQFEPEPLLSAPRVELPRFDGSHPRF
ncbi:hypothetical protein ACQJBY_050347 [Aegilops geniculata]